MKNSIKKKENSPSHMCTLWMYSVCSQLVVVGEVALDVLVYSELVPRSKFENH